MTLSDLADVSDILGAIAVIITLVYVAIQIRQSSATARAQTRQALADSQINYLNSRVTDPFLREMSIKMYSGGELDESEIRAFQTHITAHIRLFENYYTQFRLGTMDKEDWQAMRTVMKNQFRFEPYRRSFHFLEKAWNSNFEQEVNRIINELDESAA